MGTGADERDAGGYSVAYKRDDTHFPVYVTATVAAMFFAAAWITGGTVWLDSRSGRDSLLLLQPSFVGNGATDIGANQYGIFNQAFGMIRWRAVERIDLVGLAERAAIVHELQIALNAPLSNALVVD